MLKKILSIIVITSVASFSADIDKVIQIESKGNPKAVNKVTGARGLMQIMRPTWNETTKKLKKNYSWDDAFDGEKNREVGTYYLNTEISRLLRHFNIPVNDDTQLAAYNWGIGNLNRCYKKHGSNWLKYAPKETRDYIKKYHTL